MALKFSVDIVPCYFHAFYSLFIPIRFRAGLDLLAWKSEYIKMLDSMNLEHTFLLLTWIIIKV